MATTQVEQELLQPSDLQLKETTTAHISTQYDDNVQHQCLCEISTQTYIRMADKSMQADRCTKLPAVTSTQTVQTESIDHSVSECQTEQLLQSTSSTQTEFLSSLQESGSQTDFEGLIYREDKIDGLCDTDSIE